MLAVVQDPESLLFRRSSPSSNYTSPQQVNSGQIADDGTTLEEEDHLDDLPDPESPVGPATATNDDDDAFTKFDESDEETIDSENSHQSKKAADIVDSKVQNLNPDLTQSILTPVDPIQDRVDDDAGSKSKLTEENVKKDEDDRKTTSSKAQSQGDPPTIPISTHHEILEATRHNYEQRIQELKKQNSEQGWRLHMYRNRNAVLEGQDDQKTQDYNEIREAMIRAETKLRKARKYTIEKGLFDPRESAKFFAELNAGPPASLKRNRCCFEEDEEASE